VPAALREVEVVQRGREMADAFDSMCENSVAESMVDWCAAERRDLWRLMKRYAGDMNARKIDDEECA